MLTAGVPSPVTYILHECPEPGVTPRSTGPLYLGLHPHPSQSLRVMARGEEGYLLDRSLLLLLWWVWFAGPLGLARAAYPL